MKYYLQSITKRSLLLVILLLFTTTVWSQVGVFKNGVRKGMIKVKFKPEMSASLMQIQIKPGKKLVTGIQAFDAAATSTKATNMRRMFPYDPKHEQQLRKHGLHLWYVVDIDENTDPKQASATYKKINGVAAAEVDHQKVLSPYQVQEYKANGVSTMAVMPFNDPYLPKQWHYDNTGQAENFVAGSDINLFDAWKVTAGKRDVIVSIHDQGVDVSHNDLAANIWKNTAELNGIPNVDDDNNGYVDDINGWNYDTNSGKIDPEFHGTHVAGTIAAVNNNGIGVAGVAGGTGNNDGVQVMSLQCLGGGGFESSYVYAANNGAVISQNSWGYSSPGNYDQSVLDAIDYFIAEAGNYPGSPMKGGVVIFASGNSNWDLESYPGYYSNVIAVNSIGPDFKRAPYSNYGEWTDISAPGGNTSISGGGVLSTMPGNKVGYMQGTSMACPHVSGIAALALSNRTHQFTNTELRNKLLSGVVDIESHNPDFTGKLGSGFIDAARSIQNDQNIAPAAIADLTITAMAQELATLEWKVPTDGDDDKPTGFTIYHHTAPITADNLNQAEKVVITNKLNAGEIVNLEVNNLLGLTTYYFAVVSTDRWGNNSTISNVAQGTTNAGPKIGVNASSINLTVDANVSTAAQRDLTILNGADGLLRWSYLTRNKQHSLSYSSAELNYPVVTKTKTANTGILSKRPTNALSLMESKNAIAPLAFESVEKVYGQTISWYVTMIGETDTTLTNSSATKFFVTEEQGFNLTHVKSWLRHDKAKGPVIVEIYGGSTINKKNLIYAQEYKAYSNQYDENVNIKLNEQIFFEKGETFWVVFKVPAGNIYPLGISNILDKANAQNSLISFDFGVTWTALVDVLHDSNYSWTTTAASYNEHLGYYLTLNPASGDVNGNDSTKTVLSADAAKLINGTYEASVILKSNDSKTPELTVPVKLTVNGQKPVLQSEEMVEYGSVFYGKSKEMTVTINNNGYGNFNSPTVTISDPQFKIVGYAPWQIAARGQVEMIIRYTPSGFGNANAILSLKSGAITHNVNLFGVGTEPGKIDITPVSQTLDNLAIGDTVNATVTVKNTGAYPLKYFIPNYDSKGISNNWPEAFHKYGYAQHTSLPTDPKPVAYEWNDISTTGTNITSFFKDVSNDYYEVGLDFEFPFYTHTENKVYITPAGMLTFDNSVPLVNTPRLKYNDGPIGQLSATGFTWWQYANSGKVFYKKESDRLIVQYDHVKDDEWSGDYTFQIVLFDNGNIRYYYNDIETIDAYTLKYMNVLMEDREKQDGILVSDVMNSLPWKNATAIGFDYPGPDVITAVQNGSGMLMPGTSADVNITMSTAKLSEGLTNKNISIISNDPLNSLSIANVKLNVTSGGVSTPVVSKSSIDFGQVFQGAIKSDLIIIKNDGSALIGVSNVVIENGKYTLTGNTNTTITPKHAEKYEVVMPTSTLGILNDKVIITFADGTTKEITVSGEVVEAPAIAVDLSPITQTLDHGTTATVPFSIENTGKNTLEVAITGSEWATTDLAEAVVSPTNVPDFTYTWKSSADGGPKYQWMDITSKGMHVPAEELDPFEGDKFWKKVELPWPMSFYGQQYNALYIGYNGIISFSPGQPPALMNMGSIPDTAYANNFIAPLVVDGFPDTYNYGDKAGIFYLLEDDKITISFEKFMNVFSMGDPLSFQAILYKNGSIKFQYRKDGSMDNTTNLGTVGVENQDGTDGVQIASRQTLPVGDGLAYVLTPAKKRFLNPGQRLDGNIKLDATSLNAGVYNSSIHINSNVPNQESLDKPITLTVNGAPKIITADSIAFGEVMAYEKVYDQWYTGPAVYLKEFTFKNEGSAAVNITSFGFEKNTNQEFAVEAFVLNYDWFGNPYFDWTPVDWLWPLPTVNPGETLQLRVDFAPTGSESVITDNVVISADLGEYKIPVTASVVMPPVMKVDNSPIKVTFNLPTETETKTISMNNNDGKSDLKYELSIDYNRVGANSTSAESLAKTTSALLVKTDAPLMVSPLTATPLSSFNRTLQHDNTPTADGFLGVGGTSDFSTATRFNAGSEGFNLSHIQTYFRADDNSTGTIEVEIRAGGTNIVNAASLLKMSTTFTVTTTHKGSLLTIALTKAQKILPNEDFYVIITYPMELGHPQGFFNNAEKAEGRYQFNSDGLWYNMQDYPQFSTFGWMVRAAEETYEATGWVSIEGATSGSMKMGESGAINLKFAAAAADQGDHKANLVVRSNDPVDSTATVSLFMHMNMAPQFDKAPTRIVQIDENTTKDLQFITSDKEGDAITFAISNAPSWAALSSSDASATLNLKPGFNDAGSYAVTVKATDAFNHATEYTVTIQVADVNRAPIANSIQPLNLVVGNVVNINPNDWFTDADGDQPLTYNLKVVDNTLLQATLAVEQMVLNPLKAGATTLQVIADDKKGGLDTLMVNVSIRDNAAPTITNPFDNIVINLADGKKVVSVSEHFTDADGDQLSFEAISGDSSIVKASIENGSLALVPVKQGDASVLITTTDGLGGKVTATFMVKVVGNGELELSNYPNPAQDMTTIDYLVAENGHVVVTLTDASGRLLNKLVDGNQATGRYKVDVNVSTLQSGIYFYTLSVNGKVGVTQKLIKQ